jgi:hypothetical protein
MSTELSNGVIIPEEYSDDWYDEMSINLRKLNDVITAASDNATDIQRLDTDKANQSDLTALTSRVSQNETDIIALQTAVSGALKREIVQTLPTEDISTTTIYMIRNSESSGTNIYDEYMYINSQWELIGTSATDFGNYYTKNETDNLLSGKVDNSTLGSYYTKTENDNLLSAKANQTDLTSLSGRVTQNETDITALQTAVSGALKREIVQSLPTQDISTTTIYMIRNTTTSGDNIYDEYMYINSQWELIGTSATDFSNYYTKTEIDTLLSYKANDSDVVHKSGDETISGEKNFQNTATDYSGIKLEGSRVCHITADHANDGIFSDNACSFSLLLPDSNKTIHVGRWTSSNNRIILNTSYPYMSFNGSILRSNTYVPTGETNTATLRLMAQLNYADDTNKNVDIRLVQYDNAYSALYSNTDNVTSLGVATRRWSKIYGTEYYYGSNNVEFSAKFVTTDTNQTISGNKTFGNGTLIVDNRVGNNVHGEIKLNGSRPGYIVADSSYDNVFDNVNCGISILLQDAGKPLHVGGYKVDSNGRVFADNTNKTPVLSITSSLIKTATLVPDGDTANQMFRILSELSYANGNLPKVLDVRFVQYDDANASSAIYSNDDGRTTLGVGSKRWSNVVTYKVNGVEPSSLSLPSGNASNFIDISSYFSNTGSGDTNSYTALANGWIYLRLGDIDSCQANVYDANNNRMWGQSSQGSIEQITIPILKGQTLTTQWATTSSVNVATARFIPCLGNI